MSDSREGPSVLSSSAVMAAGTIVSRFSGFLRSALLAAALGTQLHGDVFNIANTIPNMLYILLAGGVFNAVLVPQLVRAMKQDADGGEAYTNRIVTVAGLFLAGVTAVMVLAAPLLMRLYLDGSFFTEALAEQRESVIDFARLCLPQVFFYGMFVLLGQVLNARGRFGPMMWAPIANNVVSVAVILTYLWAYGAAQGEEQCGGFSPGQEWLLGLGSTVGIAAQLLILLPYLRAVGFRYRPRLDLRGSGLGHTFRLASWTVGFVIVNQIAYTVVVRLASSGTADAAARCGQAGEGGGAGYTIYAGAFLLIMVPHSVATVSLATAVLPRISRHAADGELSTVAAQLSHVTRTALALILPTAAVLPVVALPLSSLIWGYAAAADSAGDFAVTLTVFAPGLVFFTVHYLMLRGFYSLERTRTVFSIQCVIAAANIAVAVLVTSMVDPSRVAPALAGAYGAAYAVGSVLSYLVLRRLLGGLETPTLVRFLVRMLLASLLTALAAWGWSALLTRLWSIDEEKVEALVLLASTGAVAAVVLLGAARAMRIREVTDLVGMVVARLRR